MVDQNRSPKSNLEEWLRRPPKYTLYRINKLKKIDSEPLVTYMEEQSRELGVSEIPKHYFLAPDCLVVERWVEDTKLKSTGKQVIVDAACAAAVLRGAHVFAPGVMGMPTDCLVGEIIDIYGDLEGKCKRGLKITYEGAKIYVGIGRLKMLRRDLYDEGVHPSGVAVHTILPASKLPVINETIYPIGDVLLQNLPSIVCGWVVNAQPHEVILDMCAAPGNKTTHLAEMSNDQATIIALDKTQQKVERIRENCTNRSITCVKAYAFDSTKCFAEDAKGISNGPPFPRNSFDKVLLDGPCSGLGQRPQLQNKMTPKMLSSFKFVQRKLFAAAVKLLKPGGKLVYSTCTVTTEENECMVAWALQEYPCLRLVPAEPLLGGPGWSDCSLADEQRLLVQRFGPDIDPLRLTDELYSDTIGFFIASFTKTEQ